MAGDTISCKVLEYPRTDGTYPRVEFLDESIEIIKSIDDHKEVDVS